MSHTGVDLVVGDIHAKMSNFYETAKLLSFIQSKFSEMNCRNLILLGDLTNDHAVLRQEIAYQLLDFIKAIHYMVGTDRRRIIVIAGNHDGASPTSTDKNSVDLLLSQHATVVSGEQAYVLYDLGYVFMPFIHDNSKFTEIANTAYESIYTVDQSPTLFCHQTFDGAAYENGHPCPSGVDSNQIKFDCIISGHIHKRQIINNKVVYVGTPRPVSSSEANDEKFIFAISNVDGVQNFQPVSTKDIVKHYYTYDISNDSQCTDILGVLSAMDLTKDDVRIRIEGSQAFYDRTVELLAPFAKGIKIIPNIKKDFEKKVNLEATNDSIETALMKYVSTVADIKDEDRGEIWKTMQNFLQ
jgi:DNA repair exonuclease SbcCD nuclease subunit